MLVCQWHINPMGQKVEWSLIRFHDREGEENVAGNGERLIDWPLPAWVVSVKILETAQWHSDLGPFTCKISEFKSQLYHPYYLTADTLIIHIAPQFQVEKWRHKYYFPYKVAVMTKYNIIFGSTKCLAQSKYLKMIATHQRRVENNQKPV